MRTVFALLAVCVLLVAVVVSIPWLVVAIGRGIIDGEAEYDRLMARVPASRLLDWWDARR